MTTQSITSGQKRQLGMFGAAAIEKACEASGLSNEEAQRIIKGGEFAELMRQAAEAVIKKLRSPVDFASEEVTSTYGYLSGYEKPLGLTEQTNLLRNQFTGLGYVNLDYQAKIENGEIKLPKYAEGWFCIPNWVKNPKLFGETYSSAVLKMFEVIKQSRNGMFYNYRENEIDEKHLRQSARTKAFFKKLSEKQGNPDILIIPAQFGLCHRGKSVRRACVVMTGMKNEFGLGTFATGCMLLTHPNRLANYNDLWIDCAGDEFAPEADGQFVDAPYFYFCNGGLEFDTGDVDYAYPRYGSVSAFVPGVKS